MIIGVVGKPNVGKSTFFKAATLMNVEIANYPFATINPNHGVGFVKIIDTAFKDFDKHANPREGFVKKEFRFVPINLIDVAGLVPGAYEGKGMGNKFLDDLNQADCLIHVIDVSGGTNEKGESVDIGSYDPAKDIEFLETELNMWYLKILKNNWEKVVRTTIATKESPHVAIGKIMSGLRVTEDMAKRGLKQVGIYDKNMKLWNDEEMLQLCNFLRKESKPMLIAANKIDVEGADKNLERLQKEFPDLTIIGCSADSELSLKLADKAGLIDYIYGENYFEYIEENKLNDAQKKALNFIKTNVLDKFGSTGVQNILNSAVFDILEYIAVHPGGGNLEDKDGNVLPDCFLMPKGTTALDFAYRLHTDFGKKFIKAVDIKTKKPIGKDHLVNNLDIIEIFHNA